MTENKQLTREQITSFYQTHLTQLTVSGDQAMALCPYHSEDHPSLSIHVPTGQFNCKSATCAKTGNVFSFIKDFGIKYDFGTLNNRILKPGLGSSQPERAPSSGPGPHFGDIIKTWDYKDAQGNLLFQEVRTTTTKALFRRPDSTKPGSWVWDLKNTRKILYRSNIAFSDPSPTPIYIVEGPKDVDSLVAIGINATTNAMGAKAWKKEYAEHFRYLNVVVLHDNDSDGQIHCLAVASSLVGIATSLKIIHLPGLGPKQDITDWLEMGHKRPELEDLVAKQAEYHLDVPKRKIELIVTGSDLIDPVLDLETKWLIPGIWVDQARGFIAGNPGVGKTWMALGMCMSVAGGVPFMDQDHAPDVGGAMIFEEESSYLNMAKRVRALISGHQYHEDIINNIRRNLFCYPRKQFKILPDLEDIIEIIKRKEIRLCVFDSLRRFHNKDENSSTEMQPVLDAFGQIQMDTGATVILIHHLHKKSGYKGNDQSVFERMRGTSDFWAWRDCIIGMEGEGSDDTKAKLSFQFRDAESATPFITSRELTNDGGIMLCKTILENTDKFQEVLEKIELKFQDHPGPQFKTAILDLIKAKQNVKWEVFKYLIKTNNIRKVGSKWEWIDKSTQKLG